MNVPNVTGWKFSASVLAGIFSGRIKTWNDPAIAGINPDVTLPALAVKTVHRGDGSRSTFLFTRYLSTGDKGWKERWDKEQLVKWPASGTEVTGSEAMAAEVAKTAGAISYVELNFANQRS